MAGRRACTRALNKGLTAKTIFPLRNPGTYTVEIRELTDEEAFRLSDIENRAREDISDFERARDYLRALDAYYGGKQQEMAERIIEREVVLIDNNGAPAGEKHFLFYNPPVVNAELGIRRSSVKEASRLQAACCWGIHVVACWRSSKN